MEEKGPSKGFRLPPPKFDKPNEPSKISTHYLTPSGMTLLPRSKQPPPMYGARGATVPAKYLAQEQASPSPAVSDVPPIYHPPKRPEHCYNCGMVLADSQDLKRHREQHEQCPAEGCDFHALHNILERHIEAHHVTGAYKKVKKVWTAEDLASWRAERRKRFPTAANVELARLAKEQRMQRGERLEASKSRFGRREDRQRARVVDGKERPNAKNRQKKRGQNKTADRRNNQGVPDDKKKPTSAAVPKKKVEKRDELSGDESSEEIQKFRGTSQMPDYKHLKPEKKQNALSGLLAMYGSDSDESESESENAEKPATLDQPKEEKTEDSPIIKDPEDVTKNKDNAMEVESKDQVLDAASSSDEAPEEEPIHRISEPALPIPENASCSKAPTVESIQPKNEQPTGKPVPRDDKRPPPAKRPAPKRVYGLNYKKARQTAQQNTMLSKLLAADIRHERNVLLQCVRHVCQSNFFGIGQPRKVPQTSSCDNKKESKLE
ncbi:hypothetical protein KR018_009966 [Drosophila ironensis]|nr:hypothetical protein KR018_009966 [Drosophila ironensis]